MNISIELNQILAITEEEFGLSLSPELLKERLTSEALAFQLLFLLMDATRQTLKPTPRVISAEHLRVVTAVAGLVILGDLPGNKAISTVKAFLERASKNPIGDSSELLKKEELKVSQTARLFGVTSRTVERWVDEEGLKQDRKFGPIKRANILAFARKQVKKHHSAVRQKFQNVLDKYEFLNDVGLPESQEQIETKETKQQRPRPLLKNQVKWITDSKGQSHLVEVVPPMDDKTFQKLEKQVNHRIKEKLKHKGRKNGKT